MSLNYVNRTNDEEIIDIVRSVLDNGKGKAETAYEHILIKLMQIRNTPIVSFEFDQKKVDYHYDQWKKYSSDSRKIFKCKKCLSEDISIKYLCLEEKIDSRCKECGHTWLENPCDSEN